MKKILLTCFILLGLVVLALVIFVATFDADRYRPLLVSKLQEAIGRPVSLERLSLGWQGGIALRLQGLAISDDAQGSAAEPLLQVESANALVRLLPLLRKEVRVASVILSRPRVYVARDGQGRINLFGLAAAMSPAAVPSRPTSVGGTAVSFNIASLRIEDGTLHWADAMTRPPTELWLKRLDVAVAHIALGQPMEIDVKGALASELPNVHLSGRLTPPSPTQSGSLEQGKLTIESLPLERILAPVQPGEPQLQGTLTVAVQGSATTLDLARLARAVSASGTLKLAEPRIINLNILREVFERFSMLPGLVEALQAHLPPTYQAKLTEPDTVFEPIDLALRVEDGALRFDDLRVRSDTFELIGTGRVGLDGTVDIRPMLRIEQALSAAIFRSVQELQALANRAGELEVPLVIQGQGPQIAVLPDLRYVASRVIAAKAADLLGSLLREEEPSAGSDTGATPSSDGSPGGILGQILQKAIRQKSSSDTAPQ